MNKLYNPITVKYAPYKLSSVFLALIILIVAILIGIVITNLPLSQVILFTIGSLLFLLILSKPYIGPLVTIVLIFLPISIGNFYGHPLYITYFAIPFMTVVYFLSKAIKRKPVRAFHYSSNPLLIPIGLYFCVTIGNYLRNPISLTQIPELLKEFMGFKAWINYFLCFCVYFMFTEMAATDAENTEKTFTLLWRLSLVLSVLGVLSIYSGFLQDVLFNLQNRGILGPAFFSLGGSRKESFALPGGGYRIGTLGSVATIGFLLLLAGKVSPRRWLKWILYGFFWYALILSGGRGGFVGAILALLVWISIQKKPKFFISAIFMAILLYLGVFVYYNSLPGSLQRILKIHGSLTQLDIGRGSTFPLYWQSFLRYPLFGVGITLTEFTKAESVSLFTYQQLCLGGHGTYLSILYLMGLAGFVPFIWGLVQGIKSSYFLSQKMKEKFGKSVTLFCFLWLIYYLIPMGFGGRGQNILYFMVFGIVSGLYIRWKRLE